mmetsp:Transcript_17819/g.41778  ORF Transcript_17819/g.41778 Transcript_17819/m.41778 type:complete len:531 (+) Transcript_17819:79-1671(+)
MAAVGPELTRAKSLLTGMLAESPETCSFHDVFAAVPRSAGGDPESVPVATMPVPKGHDFALRAAATCVNTLVVAYVLSVGIGIISALANMAGGSCGQDVWRTETSEACSALMTNSLALSLELRCHGAKPAVMSQEDFDEVCSIDALVGTIVTLILTFAYVVKTIASEVGKMPSKVTFHHNLFAVESVSGKMFECSFYADVTSAKITFRGLSLGTKAGVNLAAGGADEKAGDKFKDGKVLKVQADSYITMPCGSGTAREQFLQEFAKRLPVSIEGFGGQPMDIQPESQGDASLLGGRLGDITKARKADAYESVRKPVSCDLLTEFVAVVLMVLVAWYVFATISTLIGWAIKRGTNDCLDPMKPDEDMCAVWRIFVPISVPIVNPSDYINLVILVCVLVMTPLWYIAHLPVEQRFHKNGVLQEVLLVGQEFQINAMIFPSDVEALELVDGSMEKYVKMKVKAYYTIENGISKPFTVVAKFVTKELKLGLVDGDCASCSGHRPQAIAHRERLFQLLEEFKPGLLRTSENASER